MLDIQELKKFNDERKKYKLEPYKIILDMICNKIKETSILLNESYCVFQVPELMIGYSLYDIDDCCKWLKKKLIKLKMDDVEIINKNILVIKWSL